MSRKSRQRLKDTRKTPRAPHTIGITYNGHIVRVVTNSNYSHAAKDRDNNYRAQILQQWVDNGGLYHDPQRDGPVEKWLEKQAPEIERRRKAYEDGKLKPTREDLASVIKSFGSSVQATAGQASAELQQARAVTAERLRNPVR